METHKEILPRWDLVSNRLAAGWAGLAGGSMAGRTSLARPEKDCSSGGITEQFPSVLPIVFVVIILSCLDGVLVETSPLTAGRRGATPSHSPLSH